MKLQAPNEDFDISFDVLEKGTEVFMMLEAIDYGGGRDFVYGTGTL